MTFVRILEQIAEEGSVVTQRVVDLLHALRSEMENTGADWGDFLLFALIRSRLPLGWFAVKEIVYMSGAISVADFHGLRSFIAVRLMDDEWSQVMIRLRNLAGYRGALV